MQRFVTLAALAALTLAGAGCSNDPTVNPNIGNPTTVNFVQIDRVGKPGIKELYLPYAAHAGFNAATPSGDSGTYASQVSTFVTGTAGRSAAIGGYVSALLIPDALIADLSDTSGRASYLGYETSGQLKVDCTGLAPTAFGGRSLTDDVVSAMLGLSFGSLATTTSLPNRTPNVLPTAAPADDGNERDGRNGTPNLATQNVPCGAKGFTPQTFPYLGAPI